MLNILVQKLKEQKNSIIYYAIGLVGYSFLMISMFPTMKKTNLEEITKNMPEDFMKFFGGDGFLAYSKIEGFLSLEYLAFFFILIISFYLGSSAGSTIAGAIEKKTIDFELSQPISRTKYIISQIFVTLLNSALLVVANSLAIYLLCHAYNIEISTKGILAFTQVAILFNWAIFGYAIFFSSLFRSKLSVVLSTVVLTLGFYVLNSLSNIVEKLKDFDRFSLFYLYNPQKLLIDAQVNNQHILILLVILCLGTLSSIIIFNRKDL